MNLEATIEQHRGMFRDELAVRMVARQPPTTLDLNTGQLDSEPAAAIGMTVSGPLLRRIGHPEGYGQLFPYAKALWLLKVECRRSHPQHRDSKRPYWRGSLCHEAVLAVVVGTRLGPLTPKQAAGVLKVDDLDALLLRCFRFLEQTMDDFRRKAERRAREDEGMQLVCRCGHSWSRHNNPATMFRCSDDDGCSRYQANGGLAA